MFGWRSGDASGMAWGRVGTVSRGVAFRAGRMEEDCAAFRAGCGALGCWRAFCGEASRWSWRRVGAIRRSAVCRAGAYEGS